MIGSRLLKASASAANATATASTSAYPFSHTATLLPHAARPAPKTGGLMVALNSHLTQLCPNPALQSTLSAFGRRGNKSRVRPGSVVTVTSFTAVPSAAQPNPTTSSFSGVLMGITRRHEGRDTSIRLRQMVGRTGVEQLFKLSSPLLKAVSVVQRAETSRLATLSAGKGSNKERKVVRKEPELKAARRAKLYFVRDRQDRMPNVAAFVKRDREARERKQEAAAPAAAGRKQQQQQQGKKKR